MKHNGRGGHQTRSLAGYKSTETTQEQQAPSKEAVQNRYEAKLVNGTSDETLNSVGNFGLARYLDIVHSHDSDLLNIVLGSDLTRFGFSQEAIESSSTLYHLFASPWIDAPTKKEVEHLIAPCYYISPPFPPPSDRITKFSDETLFYIFYAMPKDFMQEWAVQVLYERGWRFHKELKVWLMIDPEAPPAIRTPTYERGTFIYFDISTWEKVKKEFIITPDQLDERPKTRV